MNWYESNDPGVVGRGAAWRIGLLVLAILALVAVIGIGVWGFKVATSDIKGQGDATRQKNDATNRIAAQQRFEDLYQEVIQSDRRITMLADATERDPSTVNQTNLTGAINYCLDVVGDYNAEARKFTAEEFRAADLPAQIDNLDPATDCQGAIR